MKKTLILILGLLVVAGLLFFLKSDSDNVVAYQDQNSGLKFSYKSGPEGYVLEEVSPSGSGEELKWLVLTPTKEVASSVVNGEGPATITVGIFQNSKNRHASVWAMENTIHSNYNLKRTEPTEAVVGGANAVRYMSDGLYATENVVVAHGGFIYVLSGMYLDENSQIRRDFLALVDSVSFVPTSSNAVSGKLDINAVCEGALAYMSFPDSASAEAFVKECKAGNRPEVIEKYKQDMNLGDGAQI